ncbi:MAG: Bifunctional RNase H/acid phosphatase [candidate division WWE3 bacterium GW2011_GWB1_44_4]|uniref:Bifunctional RNase H/acid phosphatase n=3 Tax=Katanobacteria TaxID=422282 RepID=A0A0G1KHD1_UNCKA|nr:MAG: Bifunctional RNase H/acid phosphatase [candidate division WWE3 bacterium GW2011_GWB1_44_4]KKT83141.1 MAG: Bifunctional RNase H/acid phosphatase [candidate division WWE3 bacterium GW2011_GWC2_44_9]
MTINTDGGARGNPGPGACGAVLKDSNGIILEKRGKYLGVVTNNQAEYEGIILGMELALDRKVDCVEFLLDSELIVKQLVGLYRVKEPKLIPMYQRTKNLEARLREVHYRAVPREKNKDADAVVNKVLDAHTKQ